MLACRLRVRSPMQGVTKRMFFLEFIYAFALSTQKLLARPAHRYIPLLSLVAFLTGALNTGITLVARVAGSNARAFLESPSGWRQIDWAYTLAFAGAIIIAWLGFDRRRTEIDLRFSSLKPSRTAAHRIAVGFLLIGGSVALYWLGAYYPFPGLCVYLLVIGVGSWILKRRMKFERAATKV